MELSHQPLPKTLLRLLEDEGISQRELARRTKRHGWGSVPAINMLCLGTLRPTIEAMEALGKALKIPPETFAEYRLAKARESLDPSKVSLRIALRNLDERS